MHVLHARISSPIVARLRKFVSYVSRCDISNVTLIRFLSLRWCVNALFNPLLRRPPKRMQTNSMLCIKILVDISFFLYIKSYTATFRNFSELALAYVLQRFKIQLACRSLQTDGGAIYRKYSLRKNLEVKQ